MTQSPSPLQRALARCLHAGVPADDAFEAFFPGALEADGAQLREALSGTRQGTVSPEVLAERLAQHIGSSSRALWTLLWGHDRAAVAAALAAEHLSLAAVCPPPAVPSGPARLAVHLVWHTEDGASAEAARVLTQHLRSLGDGDQAPGQGPTVTHRIWRTWPPTDIDWEAHAAHVVVLLWQLDVPHFSEEEVQASSWMASLQQAPSRVCQAVHIPENHLEPPPAGFLASGCAEFMWTGAPRSPEAIARSPVGTVEDFCAAALWALVLALGDTDALPGTSRLPVLLDHRPSSTQHPTLSIRFSRRACLPYLSLPERPPRPHGLSPSDDPILRDAELLPSAGAIHPLAAGPVVHTGPHTRLVADHRLHGAGRFTAEACASVPSTILLAAHLVVARQHWLHACVMQALRHHGGWRGQPVPSLLSLCAHALRSEAPVLVPEPAPPPPELRDLRAAGVHTEVHSITSARGPVFAGRRIALCCVPPSPATRHRWGLPEDAHPRTQAILHHILQQAGAVVVTGHSARAFLEPLRAGALHGMVLVGLEATPDPKAAPLLPPLLWETQLPIWPTGLLGGLFHPGCGPGDETRWMERLDPHNGLGPGGTARLVARFDPWAAAADILDGAAALQSRAPPGSDLPGSDLPRQRVPQAC